MLTAVGEAVGRDVEDACDDRLVEAERAFAKLEGRAWGGDCGVEVRGSLAQRRDIGDGDRAAGAAFDYFVRGEPLQAARQTRDAVVFVADRGVDELDGAEVDDRSPAPLPEREGSGVGWPVGLRIARQAANPPPAPPFQGGGQEGQIVFASR